jgi:ResB-like family
MRTLINRLVKIFTSLRLTVVLLAFGIVIVFIGTLAQVDEGLFNAQARYFRQWIILGADLFGWKIPLILPGGYLIGTLLLINLIAAHIYRFQLTVRKLGIQLAHAGVILLLVGQLTTDMLARETQLRLVQGQTKSYSESSRNYELAFTTDAGSNLEKVIPIPESVLERGGEIQNPNLPFTIHVKKFWKNSTPQFRPMMAQNPPMATNGVAEHFDFHPAAEVTSMDDKNVPTALIEIAGANGSLGDWVISGWTADDGLIPVVEQNYEQQVGPQLAQKVADDLTAAQSVDVGGKKYTFELRPSRLYFGFSMKLLKATHTVYEGTDIPKDFRSLVLLKNPQTGENRQVQIYMNAPLRYSGLTFYQYQMDAGEATREAGRTPSSVLQVVRNPSWLTPYIGCAMVAAGLIIQFLFHLVGFLSKKKAK